MFGFRLTASGALIAGVCLIFAEQATAEDWALSWGGQFDQVIVFSDVDTGVKNSNSFETALAARVFFDPSVTLDNGAALGALVELDGVATTAHHDDGRVETMLAYVQTPLGRVSLGRADTPGNRMHIGAPDGAGTEIGAVHLHRELLPLFQPYSGNNRRAWTGDDVRRGTLGGTRPSNTREDTPIRISYRSPSLSGAQFEISYGHKGANSAPNRRNFWDIGANYRTRHGQYDLGISAKWGRAGNPSVAGDHPTYWGIGAQAARARVTAGISFAQTSGSAQSINDGWAVEAGVSYQTGPWTMSLNYLRGKNTDDENAALGLQETLETYAVGLRYALSDRAHFKAFGAFVNFNEAAGDRGPGMRGDNVDGTVLGIGFGLEF